MESLTHQQLALLIGIKLGVYLKHNKIAQSSLCELFGVQQANVSRITSGGGLIRLDYLLAAQEKFPDFDATISEETKAEIVGFMNKVPSMSFVDCGKAVLSKELTLKKHQK